MVRQGGCVRTAAAGARRTYLRLYDAVALCSQQLHRLIQIDDSFVTHPLEHDAQRDEHARSADAGAEHNKYTVIILDIR